TQSAANYSVDGLNADGFEMGSLEDFNINSAGIVEGTYSNGRTQNLAQVAVASFSNPSGLKRTGDTLFTSTKNSGDARVGVPGSGSRGEISAGSLEMSNVDLAKQFTEMITTQRGFQANSKTITTTDEMLQQLVNLKR
ncbi:MAG: flagellar hook-basal body complex protein, partial [Bacillota bacterium]